MKSPQYILEDVHRQREILLKETDFHKEEMDKKISSMTTDAKKIGMGLLLVGGAFAVAYLVTRGIFSSKKPKVVRQSGNGVTEVVLREPRRESDIVRMIKDQITLFLMSIVKEKLNAYLKGIEIKK
ncbi:hypothetical protein [Sporocytophaga myxococcoides]|uniref:hypothetical protein n=1 Tax=Sporocytophaga myxococcoides TaxID=153721 RepID=UPI000406DADF|nr:hypothetical protein [Sporocytophaga myxococcoides]